MDIANEPKKSLRDIRTIGFVLIGLFVFIFPAWIMMSHDHETDVYLSVFWAVLTIMTGVGLILHKRWGCLLVYGTTMALTAYILYRTMMLFFANKTHDVSETIGPLLIIDAIIIFFAIIMNLALRKYWRYLRW
jgi:hypothetical protein